MVMFLILYPLVFIFLNLFVLLGCPVMLMTFYISNKVLIPKSLKQGYRYHKIGKAYSKVYRRHFGEVLNKCRIENTSSARAVGT